MTSGVAERAFSVGSATVLAPVERLRIVHLLNELSRVGNGIVNVAIDLAVEQAREGHDVTVAAPDGSYRDLLLAHGVRHFRLEQRGGARPLTAVVKLQRYMRHNRTQIVHAHMMTGAVIGRLARVGTGAKLVTSVHNSWQRHAGLMRLGDRVIAVSDAVRDEMTARGIGAWKIATVRNATEGSVRAVAADDQPRISLEHPNVLTVAGMFRRKGIADLIECAAIVHKRVPAARFYLAGEGPDRAAFERLVHERGIERSVTFLGFQSDVGALLAQADVFVLASHAEPFGLVLSEARSASVPIVATRVGGIPEALDGGAAGVLVAPHDPEALARELERMLTDGAFRKEMSARAFANAEDRHVARAARETMQVYQLAVRAAGTAP